MDAYILDGVYIPRGRAPKGALSAVSPARLGAYVLQQLAQRLELDPKKVSDVLMGIVTQNKEQGANLAKTATMLAAWPDSVPAATVNRHCASGLAAISWGAHKVASGCCELIVAGGIESMSRVPIMSDQGSWFADAEISKATGFLPMGVAADLLATRHGIERAELDSWALESQRRAQDSAAGRSMVPFSWDDVRLEQEECPRWVSSEKLAALEPPFGQQLTPAMEAMIAERYDTKVEARHTVGTSPALADGAAALALIARAEGEAQGFVARARITAIAEVATDPVQMLEGNVLAVRSALRQAKWSTNDVDVFEVNESFAAVPIHFARHLNVNPERINIGGGAIALGHPLGATGAILTLRLLDQLDARDKRRGVVSICGGAGVATAMAVERL